jgi:ribosome-associated translation inhibitor RaiA
MNKLNKQINKYYEKIKKRKTPGSGTIEFQS